MTFHTTRWSVVRAAGGEAPAERRAALETLCRAYWRPVHAFVRRNAGAEQAEDLTQAFFARLLEKGDLAEADPERGRFRTFLLAGVRHFLANEHDRERALKRGGGRRFLSLDAPAEDELAPEPADADTPERAFERAWAGAVLARALERLGEEQRHAGKERVWEALRPYLTAGEERAPSADLARELGLGENAVRVAAHRLRRRFGELVRDEVRETVGPGEVEDELCVLRAALEPGNVPGTP